MHIRSSRHRRHGGRQSRRGGKGRRPAPAIRASLLLLAPAGPFPSADPGSFDIRERIRTDTLVILAHPDDEGVVAPLLAREALERKTRVAVVYLTDGRNGANRAGDLRGRAFGVVRLAEVRWTLERLGVSVVHCLDLPDAVAAGDPEEVLRKWGREETVGRLARLIRLLRPDEILTWFPGPASSNADHMAAGGAAILAAQAAADSGAFRKQIEFERLETWAAPRLWLLAQAEKLGYERYPDGDRGAARPGHEVRSIRLDGFSESLGRRYTDLAREAMREQRAVAAANNLRREGPFDDPVLLWPVLPESGATGGTAGGIDLEIEGPGPQEFLTAIAEEAGAGGILRHFPPEARVPAGAASSLRLRIAPPEGGALPAAVELDLPRGWKARPSRQEIPPGSGGPLTLEWTVTVPQGTQPGHYEAALRSRGAGGSREADRAGDAGGLPARFVVTVPEANLERQDPSPGA